MTSGISEEQKQYWTNRWREQKTGWHLPDPHPSLVKNLPKLVQSSLTEHPVIFVPLCGKSVDLRWLRDHNFRALGCELSEQAVTEFFTELGETPRKTQLKADLQKWEVKGITVIVGNIFDVEDLGSVIDAVFDRASLVALPSSIRGSYVAHVKQITSNANQILVTFEHTRTTAPPHSISEELVNEYYSDTYEIELVSRRNVGDKIDEATYLLKH